MRLIPSDPDIATVVNRIRDRSLDLQPDFQRGAVWSQTKRQLLIDSILRNWYIPPIHIVRTEGENQVVLDGQQRLRSISEFVDGALSVDGKAEPFSEEIFNLDGLRYADLPEAVRRRFDRFTLRIFEVIDYEPEEPYELFYRLNQPTALTFAEQRNAFFGPPRDQIRELAGIAADHGMIPARVGFTNARLSYEDIIARFLWTLEAGTLAERVTARHLTERYRSGRPFNHDVFDWGQGSLVSFFANPALDDGSVKFNRATVYSWLCFTARALRRDKPLQPLVRLVPQIEHTRARFRRPDVSESYPIDGDVSPLLYTIFNDRATSRVSDASSVILRDAILWIFFANASGTGHDDDLNTINLAAESANSIYEAEDAIISAAYDVGWVQLR
jgi:hypothetical protein